MSTFFQLLSVSVFFDFNAQNRIELSIDTNSIELSSNSHKALSALLQWNDSLNSNNNSTSQ